MMQEGGMMQQGSGMKNQGQVGMMQGGMIK
jgi:hypothetical protein